MVIMTVFFTALICSSFLILMLRRMAHDHGFVDLPGGRKQHDHPTPTVGGVAMFLAVVVALYAGRAYTETMMLLIGCAGALVLLGILDDRHELKVSLRITTQAAVSVVVILWADGAITHLGSLVGGQDIQLNLLAVPFSMVAFVGGINAVNMIDGADGMAGKMAAITALGVGAIFYLSDASYLLTLVLAVIGALVGFLSFNSRLLVRRAWVFMGDAGSMWLGLILGWFMTQVVRGPVSAEPPIVFWLFGIPVVDTLAVITRRIRRNKSPFSPDRTHIHHVFQHNGYSVSRTVALLSVVQCILVGTGVCFYVFKAPAAIVFWSFVLLMVVYFLLLYRFHDSSMKLAKIPGRAGNKLFKSGQE